MSSLILAGMENARTQMSIFAIVAGDAGTGGTDQQKTNKEDDMDDQEKEDLKETIRDLLREIIADAQDPAFQPVAEADPSGPGSFFTQASILVDEAQEKYSELGGVIDMRVGYLMLAFLVETAIELGVLDDDEQWSKVIELFETRANEFAGHGDAFRLEPITDPTKWVDILRTIVTSWKLGVEAYSPDGFSEYERVFVIRGLLISLRNQRVLKYDQWLKDLLASLYTDWKLLGGGWPTTIPGGPQPWSGG